MLVIRKATPCLGLMMCTSFILLVSQNVLQPDPMERAQLDANTPGLSALSNTIKSSLLYALWSFTAIDTLVLFYVPFQAFISTVQLVESLNREIEYGTAHIIAKFWQAPRRHIGNIMCPSLKHYGNMRVISSPAITLTDPRFCKILTYDFHNWAIETET